MKTPLTIRRDQPVYASIAQEAIFELYQYDGITSETFNYSLFNAKTKEIIKKYGTHRIIDIHDDLLDSILPIFVDRYSFGKIFEIGDDCSITDHYRLFLYKMALKLLEGNHLVTKGTFKEKHEVEITILPIHVLDTINFILSYKPNINVTGNEGQIFKDIIIQAQKWGPHNPDLLISEVISKETHPELLDQARQLIDEWNSEEGKKILHQLVESLRPPEKVKCTREVARRRKKNPFDTPAAFFGGMLFVVSILIFIIVHLP